MQIELLNRRPYARHELADAAFVCVETSTADGTATRARGAQVVEYGSEALGTSFDGLRQSIQLDE